MTKWPLKRSLVTKILQDSFWVLLGTSFGRIFTFTVSIMVARFSSKDEFGQFMMIRNTVATVESGASGSLGNILVMKVAIQREGYGDRLQNVLAASMLINIFLFSYFYHCH